MALADLLTPVSFALMVVLAVALLLPLLEHRARRHGTSLLHGSATPFSFGFIIVATAGALVGLANSLVLVFADAPGWTSDLVGLSFDGVVSVVGLLYLRAWTGKPTVGRSSGG